MDASFLLVQSMQFPYTDMQGTHVKQFSSGFPQC